MPHIVRAPQRAGVIHAPFYPPTDDDPDFFRRPTSKRKPWRRLERNVNFRPEDDAVPVAWPGRGNTGPGTGARTENKTGVARDVGTNVSAASGRYMCNDYNCPGNRPRESGNVKGVSSVKVDGCMKKSGSLRNSDKDDRFKYDIVKSSLSLKRNSNVKDGSRSVSVRGQSTSRDDNEVGNFRDAVPALAANADEVDEDVRENSFVEEEAVEVLSCVDREEALNVSAGPSRLMAEESQSRERAEVDGWGKFFGGNFSWKKAEICTPGSCGNLRCKTSSSKGRLKTAPRSRERVSRGGGGDGDKILAICLASLAAGLLLFILLSDGKSKCHNKKSVCREAPPPPAPEGPKCPKVKADFGTGWLRP